MKFSSIVRKNFTYNFNKYISFYFVNSLIIAMLFMYGSLIFNSTIIQSIGEVSSLYGSVKTSLIGIILFSIVFITYTNISFLKNRGKEFGMYLTLGMTTRDLIKLIFVENLGIMIASLLTGIVTGALFGRLFYMGLNKILIETNILYELNYKSFLLSIGVFVLIFLGNFIFNIFYIRKVSIIDAIKANKKKEIGKANLLIGIISLIILIILLYCLPKVLRGEMFRGKSYMIGIFVASFLICPYMLIGSFIYLIKRLLSKFPKLYNRNLLVLSNLSHRFLGYKSLIYMLSLLVTGAMFFVGFSYSDYFSIREDVNLYNPYDIMFVETDEYNRVEKEQIQNIIKKNNGEIEKYSVLEYIKVNIFTVEGEQLAFFGDKNVISETNYNKHMETSIHIKLDEALDINISNKEIEGEYAAATLVTMDEKQLEEINEIASQENDYLLSKKDYEKIVGENDKLYLSKDKIKKEKGVPFINTKNISNYSLGTAFVVDDKSYEVLKAGIRSSSIKKVHLMNIKNGDKAFENLVNYLREESGLDNSYWNEANILGGIATDKNKDKESYRPIYKEELIKAKLDKKGIRLFTMIFMGLLFIIANGICLYYKVLSDIDEEEERIISLNRIGTLEKEVKSIISKELAIIFFLPILIGGGLGVYLLYAVVSCYSEITGLIMKKSIVILLIGAIIQGVFYLISRKKYIKEVVG